MRTIAGILSAILLLALAVAGAQEKTGARPNDTTEQVLVANERALHSAVARRDKASFLSLVHGDGVWTTKQGFTPMKLLADGLDAYELTKWDIVNPRVTRIDENSAIVLYAWTGAGTFQNQPVASTMLASTVWNRRDGKWVVVHHQQTDLSRN